MKIHLTVVCMVLFLAARAAAQGVIHGDVAFAGSVYTTNAYGQPAGLWAAVRQGGAWTNDGAYVWYRLAATNRQGRSEWVYSTNDVVLNVSTWRQSSSVSWTNALGGVSGFVLQRRETTNTVADPSSATSDALWTRWQSLSPRVGTAIDLSWTNWSTNAWSDLPSWSGARLYPWSRVESAESADYVTGPQSNMLGTALQPSWAATGTVAHAVTVTGPQSNALAAAIAVASTNLQSALDAEAAARASGDLVAMTNWQARVNALTNGAALGATALQPAATNGWTVGSHAGLLTPQATNTLAAAAAHAGTEHSVTEVGGFQAGQSARATYGGAVGSWAYTTEGGAAGIWAASVDGGAVGSGANATHGGAVGYGAFAADGGAVGAWTYSGDGGAVGVGAKTSDGFAGGKDAYATSDGDFYGDLIDAIQLGTGGNSTPRTLQIYTHRLLNADGTIPIERMSLHDGDGTAHPDIREAIDAIPLPPTNAVVGWLVWDEGSNVYWRVTATNLRFYVWGVAE